MPHRPKGSRFWHYDFRIRGRRFCGSTGTEDFEAAKAVEAAARVRAAAAPEVTGRYTISQALGTYWTDVCQHQPSARVSASQAKMILEHLEGTRAIEDLTNADIQRAVAKMRATAANATVNRRLQLLGRAIRHMVAVHGAAMPPIDLRRFQTDEPEERVRELTMEEQGRLFEKLRVDLHPMVTFALMTGARESEITGLKWADVDTEHARIRFHLKGGKTLRFPMNAEIRALMSGLPRSELPAERAFVFTYVDHSEKAKPRRRITSLAAFRKAVREAEIEDFRFHDLRHTFATRLLRQTGNLKLVSRLLGHTKVETTARYAHVLDDDLAAALDGYRVLAKPESRRKSRAAPKMSS